LFSGDDAVKFTQQKFQRRVDAALMPVVARGLMVSTTACGERRSQLLAMRRRRIEGTQRPIGAAVRHASVLENGARNRD
jgi:hypothetical protein